MLCKVEVVILSKKIVLGNYKQHVNNKIPNILGDYIIQTKTSIT